MTKPFLNSNITQRVVDEYKSSRLIYEMTLEDMRFTHPNFADIINATSVKFDTNNPLYVGSLMYKAFLESDRKFDDFSVGEWDSSIDKFGRDLQNSVAFLSLEANPLYRYLVGLTLSEKNDFYLSYGTFSYMVLKNKVMDKYMEESKTSIDEFYGNVKSQVIANKILEKFI